MKKPGLRNIKTALSVVICALTIEVINLLTGLEIEYFYAGITAVFTLQQTDDATKNKAKSRVFGTIVGALVAIVIGWVRFEVFPITNEEVLVFINLIYLFIGIVVVIWIINNLKLEFGIMIGCIMVISSFTIHEDYYILYTILRALETFYGAFVSILVNKYVFPYKK